MPKFVPGEIARISPTARATEIKLQPYIGNDVECVKYIGFIAWLDDVIQNWWMVKGPDGVLFYVAEHILIKKRPPEEKGSWDIIEQITKWNPTKVEVLVTRRKPEPITLEDVFRWRWL